jgi:hypothetical protein
MKLINQLGKLLLFSVLFTTPVKSTAVNLLVGSLVTMVWFGCRFSFKEILYFFSADLREKQFWNIADNINNSFTDITNREDGLAKVREISLSLAQECSQSKTIGNMYAESFFEKQIPYYIDNYLTVNKEVDDFYNKAKQFDCRKDITNVLKNDLMKNYCHRMKIPIDHSFFSEAYFDMIQSNTPDVARSVITTYFIMEDARFLLSCKDQKEPFIRETFSLLLDKIHYCYKLPSKTNNI